MKNKITHVAWMAVGDVGVVRTETEYDGTKFYIKSFHRINAGDERHDAISTAQWGYSLPTDVGQLIIDRIGKPFELEY